ncbi:hypothetical protein BU14_0216s0012 [Porphyra umbilicalis]|uniref:Uncharacterized protein n=1 Tax=Porphyra umbilicalis TaxID=2786 RepID=A0A1X6P4W1_PORUM|nr:hypothetical protein BU14_0216s0012 [Porphyra umbilicalis]|eukprot:OSX75921.1 hypothetical protein BU14_0216s0012 [Porphyra umbilicalis]
MCRTGNNNDLRVGDRCNSAITAKDGWPSDRLWAPLQVALLQLQVDALPTPSACVARLAFALHHCTSGAFYGPLPLHVFVADPSTSGGGDSGSGLVRPRGGDGACATGELLKLFGLHAGAGGDTLRHQRAPGPSVD